VLWLLSSRAFGLVSTLWAEIAPLARSEPRDKTLRSPCLAPAAM